MVAVVGTVAGWLVGLARRSSRGRSRRGAGRCRAAGERARPAGARTRGGRCRRRDRRDRRRHLRSRPRRRALRPARLGRRSPRSRSSSPRSLGGAADESRLAEGEAAGLVLLLLPGLIAFAAAVAAARLFGPLVRLARRLVDRSVGARLAAVTLGRGPGAAAVTVAFLTLAFALALLAEGYRATLVRAEGDQASFAVPLDFVVREDLKSLVPGSRCRAARALRRCSPADPRPSPSCGSARARETPRGSAGSRCSACPSREISRVHGWRDGFSDRSRASLAAAVAPPAGTRRPGHPARLEAPIRGRPRRRLPPRDDRDGRRALSARSTSARSRPHAPTRVDRALPRRLRGGTLVALELVPPRLDDRGADAGSRARRPPPARGARRRRGVDRRRRCRRPPRSRTASTSATGSRSRAMRGCGPDRPRTASPPAVLVTPRLGVLAGGEGGTLALAIGGSRVPVRVAAIVDHFPGTERGRRDRRSRQPRDGRQHPGSGRRADERGLARRPLRAGRHGRRGASSRAPPFRGVEAVSRRGVARRGARRPPRARHAARPRLGRRRRAAPRRARARAHRPLRPARRQGRPLRPRGPGRGAVAAPAHRACPGARRRRWRAFSPARSPARCSRCS